MQRFLHKFFIILCAMPYSVAVCAEEYTFIEFVLYKLPVSICHISNNKIFFCWIFVVKLQRCFISRPSAIFAFTPEIFYCRKLCAESPYFCITRSTTGSAFILVVLKLIITNSTNFHCMQYNIQGSTYKLKKNTEGVFYCATGGNRTPDACLFRAALHH